ncbi:DUF2514 family protein [Burkholderia vietnamiensis]|uniref:DUF2514 family protein n=1 Tax=Burkholderia vietnamiensis TaxID=60552 RepID=UPI00075750CF|nr:DUF2514 family protein [Burkholderia vietnamiensis]KVF81853.1 hypothetical protein WJ18_06955 [Burkholderia vietnamiensis]KVF85931.1 hypothetical protein WJ20_24565 [Burkholderia vietnamiensis]KVF89472.1 hypothetical protein WJ19_05970 [Burkholderia vietnamiensis]KVG01311.1 hypothetical protein WJ22_13185 [Burkholderia vietnamiensis]MBR8049574.1 DUF2514 family protein [Burkholderia vietnamiensis]
MTWIDPRIWLLLVAGIVAGATCGYFKGHRDADQTAKVAAQAKQIDGLQAERDESNRRAAAQSENAKDANQQRTAALADAFAARAAAGSLQQRVDQLVAAARHPAATTGSPTAGDALDLLADVLGRADQRSGELAEYADRARIAGQQCERDYDALIVRGAAE